MKYCVSWMQDQLAHVSILLSPQFYFCIIGFVSYPSFWKSLCIIGFVSYPSFWKSLLNIVLTLTLRMEGFFRMTLLTKVRNSNMFALCFHMFVYAHLKCATCLFLILLFIPFTSRGCMEVSCFVCALHHISCRILLSGYRFSPPKLMVPRLSYCVIDLEMAMPYQLVFYIYWTSSIDWLPGILLDSGIIGFHLSHEAFVTQRRETELKGILHFILPTLYSHPHAKSIHSFIHSFHTCKHCIALHCIEAKHEAESVHA